MLSSVHTDRSGRVIVSGDYGAAGFDGLNTTLLVDTVPLPEGARLGPLARVAEGFDRAGRRRPLGRDRWAMGAILPAGFTRTLHPAYQENLPSEAPIETGAWTAVGAGAGGELLVAAIQTGPSPAGELEDSRLINDALRARPASLIVRQLARCARDHGCGDARRAFTRSGCAALPIASSTNEESPAGVAPRLSPGVTVTEPATFRPTAEEIADLAVDHLESGGERVGFGRACEGDPLNDSRLVEDAIRRIRKLTAKGRIHLETSGSSPAGLRRLADAGLDQVTVRLASARAEVYEALHGPIGYRFSDVRTSLQAARDANLDLELAVLVFPGLTDRPTELAAFTALLREFPKAAVLLRDLAGDSRRVMALAPSAEVPIGVSLMAATLSGAS